MRARDRSRDVLYFGLDRIRGRLGGWLAVTVRNPEFVHPHSIAVALLARRPAHMIDFLLHDTQGALMASVSLTHLSLLRTEYMIEREGRKKCSARVWCGCVAGR